MNISKNRRKAAVQRRDLFTQQRLYFARNRDQRVQGGNRENRRQQATKPRPSNSNTDQPARPSKLPTHDEKVELNLPRQKKKRKSLRLNADFLALNFASKDILQDVMPSPQQKRRKTVKNAVIPQECPKVNRSVAVNARSNSVRVFENEVEKTPSLSLRQGPLEAWRAHATPEVEEKGIQGYNNKIQRDQATPEINEGFSCFSRIEKLENEASQRRGGVQSSGSQFRSLSPSRWKKKAKTPSVISRYWNAEAEIENKRGQKNPSPVTGSVCAYLNGTSSPPGTQNELRAPSPTGSVCLTPSDEQVDDDVYSTKEESRNEEFSAPPSPDCSRVPFAALPKKQEPMSLDDFSAEIAAIEDRLFCIADADAGRFTIKNGCSNSVTRRLPSRRGAVRVAVQSRNEIEEERKQQTRGNADLRAVPRQTFLEGVEPSGTSGAQGNDEVVVALCIDKSPFAATSATNGKASFPAEEHQRSTADGEQEEN